MNRVEILLNSFLNLCGCGARIAIHIHSVPVTLKIYLCMTDTVKQFLLSGFPQNEWISAPCMGKKCRPKTPICIPYYSSSNQNEWISAPSK